MPAALIAPPPTVAEWPANRKWTREQFQNLSSQGFFESTRAILIHGDILEQGPMNAPHATGVRKVDKALNRIFGAGYDVRNQLPLNLEADTEPRPMRRSWWVRPKISPKGIRPRRS